MRTTRVLLSTATAVALTATTLAATSAAAESPSPSANRAEPYTVTARADNTELVLGQKVTITGRVKPLAKGKRVILQKKTADRKWKDQSSDLTNKRGKFELTDRPITMNPRKYRVVKPASARHRKGISKSMPVTMLQWHDVYDLAYRAAASMYRISSLTIDTVEFPKSLAGVVYDDTDPTGFIDYNLERTCTTLKATYGMSDDADTGSSVKLDVVGDGTELYTGTFALLESQPKTLDIRGVFRLAFQFESLNAEHAVPAVGSPRVLCSF